MNKGDFWDCCGGDIGDVNDKEILIYVYSLKIKDIVKVNGFLFESLKLDCCIWYVNIYYNYGVNVYVRCIVRYSVFEVCGIELD